MSEQSARVGEIDVAYEVFGEEAGPALLLIMGLATQMLGWDVEFCAMLAARGFRVIRFDNRDVGRRESIEGGPPPDLGAAMAGGARLAPATAQRHGGRPVGLLDPLGIEAPTWSAHRWAG